MSPTLLHPQCDNIQVNSYIQNLTSSYIDKSHESTVVASSLFMFVLAASFFIFNLFSRVSDISAVLNPTIRSLLSSALSLFLPIMSYLFSEAKNSSSTTTNNVRGGSSSGDDLPMRARMILMWMLLVELLRKKVEVILSTAGMQAYSSIITHAGSVAWLGNLVFFNLKTVGRKSLFGILWLLCAVKVVQRAAIVELAKRSFAYSKNARLVSSYMAQLVEQQQQEASGGQARSGSERLKACKYVVMGEENLFLKEGSHGYKLDLDKVDTDDDVVTVGRIWSLIKRKDHRRLCLSFAFFKLFRPRFEHLPAMKNKEETSNCRDLIFEGLCKEEEEEGVNNDEVLFQVIHDEASFLSEYYHSVLPVVLASPYFFVVNYLVLPIVVFQLCLMLVALCGEGDIILAFHRIKTDNFALSSGIGTLTRCLWKHFWSSPAGFSSTMDLSISFLLFLVIVYEEVWEFIIFVVSNWFMVSLLCTYAAKLRRQDSPAVIGWVIRHVAWARRILIRHSRNIITMKQFSMLSFSWLSMTQPTQPLPKQAKSSIVKRMRLAAAASDHEQARVPLSNGQSVLNGMNCSHLAWFCNSDSIAEVILTWHIATTLLENGASSSSRPPRSSHHNKKKVAMGLSKYCAYLVAFKPEMLPDDHEGTERVFKDMKSDLKEALGCWGYYFSCKTTRYKKLVTLNPSKLKPKCRDEAMTVIEKGIVLMEELKRYVAINGNNEGLLWRLLADLWVELLVYIAPSAGEENLVAHEKALVQPGELITLLWVLATHIGITRPPPPRIQPVDVNVEEGSTRQY